MTDEPAKTDYQRDAAGRFGPGNPGRKQGSKHRATLAVEAILEGQAEVLTNRAVEMAMAGDTTAMRLVLERLVPPRRDRHIEVDLPLVKTAADATVASGKIVEAVSAGELTPTEGEAVSKILDVHVRNIEMREVEQRLAALEERTQR